MTINFKFTYDHAKYQIYAALIVNIASVTHGTSTGWLQIALMHLKSSDSPLSSGPVTNFQLSWIASGSLAGTVIGALCGSILLQYFGPETTAILAMLPVIINWIVLLFFLNITNLIICRILVGVSIGAIFLSVPIFLAAIADSNIRGTLVTFYRIFVYVGMIVGNVVCAYVPFKIGFMILVIIPIAFICLFSLFVPKNPTFYIHKGEYEKAKKSFLYYKNCKQLVDVENNARCIEELENFLKYMSEHKTHDDKLHYKDFCTPKAKRGLLTGICIVFLQANVGTVVIIIFSGVILLDSTNHIDARIATILTTVLMLIGNLAVNMTLVDIFGRKILLIGSLVGCSISLFFIGLYYNWMDHGNVKDTFSWVPVTGVLINLFAASCGITSLPAVIITEVLPEKIRSIGASLCWSFLFFFTWLQVTVYPIVTKEYGIEAYMWFYATIATIAIILCIFCYDETKGSNVNYIQDI